MMEDRKEDKEDSRHSRGLKGEDFFSFICSTEELSNVFRRLTGDVTAVL